VAFDVELLDVVAKFCHFAHITSFEFKKSTNSSLTDSN